jgi:hypothetical protein
MSPATPVVTTKMIKIDDPTAKQYIGKKVYGISGYPYGVLEEVRVDPSTFVQEFWVRNQYGLIQFHYFCLPSEDWK